ncbi:DNA polymerase III subunit beta [Desulfohalovibrio reitneri]|uniref:DNA polymerase III subunit beta n=1 Tax=Desulfohalovibrio reitneri TaxID=1307759 RepID=UPI0004A6FEA1|nr:DNA polymerase III subunit beta [Desulfohalovibrio reitneri]
MYLRVIRDDIIEGLHKSSNIIPAKTGAAFLRTIWMKAEGDTLRIMSTDSNLEFTGAYPATVQEEGLAGVQGRSFYDLVRKLPPGEITVRTEAEGSNLLIEQGKRKYKLPTNDPTWFQKFSDHPESGGVYWSGDFLQELIDRVSYCISDEDTMEAIACMNVVPVDGENGKSIRALGLNGHQFAMLGFTNDDIVDMLPEGGMLIQKKYLTELKKWLSGEEIEMALDDKRLFFRTRDQVETFSLPLSFYQYPDYTTFLSKVSDDAQGSLTLDREELADSLDRILIFNSENNRTVSFSFENGEMQLFSQGQDVGTANETLPVEFSGGLDKIAFPTRNLIEILSHFNSERVTFNFTGSEGPCGIRGEDDPEYLVIIMPMKIVEETYYTEEEA